MNTQSPLVPPVFDTTERDEYYWKKLDEIAERRNYNRSDLMRNWSAYVMRRDLIRFIAHYELFKFVVDVPGHIVELGTYRGASFFTWGNLLETFCPFDRQRRAYGFDSFAGLANFKPEDGADALGNVTHDEIAMRYPGAFLATEYEARALCDMHNADAMIPGKERSTIVAGDIMQTLPAFLDANPGFRVSLVHFDVDLYEPTKLGLDLLYSRLVTGGVFAFDEYAFTPWPGESKAVDEFIAGLPKPLKLKKFPFAQAPCYFIKE